MHADWLTVHMWPVWLFWIVVALLIFWAISRLVSSPRDHKRISFRKDTPIDILKKRYAKGEMSEEEFEKMKERLEL